MHEENVEQIKDALFQIINEIKILETKLYEHKNRCHELIGLIFDKEDYNLEKATQNYKNLKIKVR